MFCTAMLCLCTCKLPLFENVNPCSCAALQIDANQCKPETCQVPPVLHDDELGVHMAARIAPKTPPGSEKSTAADSQAGSGAAAKAC